jgi:hypothetical protein
MTTRNPLQPKKVPIEKVAVIHVCTEKEQINRLNLILVGNGHPEDGLAFKVAKMLTTHETVSKDIGEIKTSIKELAQMYDDTFEAAKTAQSALEKYKSEVANFDEGGAKLKAQLRANYLQKVQTLGIVFTGLALVFTIIMGIINLTKTDTVEKAVLQNKEMLINESNNK